MIDQEMSDLIGMIYDAALNPDLWPAVLERVAVVTPAATVALYSHDRVARIPTFHHQFGGDPIYTARYIETYAASNPLIDGMAVLNVGEVSGIAGVMDYEAFTRTPFYREWGRPQGYCDAINVILERTPTRVSSLSLIRHDRHGVADAGAVRRLSLLAPHLLRAVRIGRTLEHSAARADTLEATLDALSSAVVLFDRRGKILHVNARAHELGGQGLSLGRIEAMVGGLAADEASPEAPLRGTVGQDHAFTVESAGGAPYVCHMMPFAPRPDQPDGRLVVIQDATGARSAVRTARSLYGLTPREAEVLFGIVEVGGAPAVGAMLGVTTATVTSHLKALFRKTNTARQSDLVKLVGSLASPFRDAPT